MASSYSRRGRSFELSLRNVMHETEEIVDWMQLGLQLGLTLSRLKQIRANSRTVEECRMEMINFWLENTEVPSWEKLISAIDLLWGQGHIARKMRNKFHIQSVRTIASDGVPTAVNPRELLENYRILRSHVTSAISHKISVIKEVASALRDLPASYTQPETPFLPRELLPKSPTLQQINTLLSDFSSFATFHLLDTCARKIDDSCLHQVSAYRMELERSASSTTLCAYSAAGMATQCTILPNSVIVEIELESEWRDRKLSELFHTTRELLANNLPEYCLVFSFLSCTGSISTVWITTSTVFDALVSLVRRSGVLLRRNRVREFRIDRRVYFPEDVAFHLPVHVGRGTMPTASPDQRKSSDTGTTASLVKPSQQTRAKKISTTLYPSCSKHAQQSVSFYCKTCKRYLCHLCMIGVHEHAAHTDTVELIKDTMTVFQKRLHLAIPQNKETASFNLKKIKDLVTSKRQSIENANQLTRARVNNFFEFVHQQISARKAQVLASKTRQKEKKVQCIHDILRKSQKVDENCLHLAKSTRSIQGSLRKKDIASLMRMTELGSSLIEIQDSLRNIDEQSKGSTPRPPEKFRPNWVKFQGVMEQACQRLKSAILKQSELLRTATTPEKPSSPVKPQKKLSSSTRLPETSSKNFNLRGHPHSIWKAEQEKALPPPKSPCKDIPQNRTATVIITQDSGPGATRANSTVHSMKHGVYQRQLPQQITSPDKRVSQLMKPCGLPIRKGPSPPPQLMVTDSAKPVDECYEGLDYAEIPDTTENVDSSYKMKCSAGWGSAPHVSRRFEGHHVNPPSPLRAGSQKPVNFKVIPPLLSQNPSFYGPSGHPKEPSIAHNKCPSDPYFDHSGVSRELQAGYQGNLPRSHSQNVIHSSFENTQIMLPPNQDVPPPLPPRRTSRLSSRADGNYNNKVYRANAASDLEFQDIYDTADCKISEDTPGDDNGLTFSVHTGVNQEERQPLSITLTQTYPVNVSGGPCSVCFVGDMDIAFTCKGRSTIGLLRGPEILCPCIVPSCLTSVTVDMQRDPRIYTCITNMEGHLQVVVYCPDGRKERSVRLPENVTKPKGLAVDGKEQFYIILGDRQRVAVFSSQGIFVDRFVNPDKVELKSLAVSKDGSLLVAIEHMKRLWVWDTRRRTAESFTIRSPLYVALINDKYVALTTGNNRILIADMSGQVVVFLDGGNRQGAQLRSPLGISVSDDHTKLAVADHGNKRIQVYKIDEEDDDAYVI